MIFWCHDQDLFCAAWYEIQTLEEIINRICFCATWCNISNMDNKPGSICAAYNIYGARSTEL